MRYVKEVLKHASVEQAVQIDIDERVTRLARFIFPSCANPMMIREPSWNSSTALKQVKEAAPDSVDMIIVDSADPVGPAEGLFSDEFYRDCFNCLSENGMIVQQSESALSHEAHR